ncbi:MAG: hypothetical protein Q8934_16505, partial [Bacillota bacterium]|nr:hypothetical protein [Bacillota bacterium]
RRGGSRSARGKRASGAEINLPVYEVLPFLSKIKKIAEKKYPFLDNLKIGFYRFFYFFLFILNPASL